MDHPQELTHASSGASQQPDYWPVVRRLVALGRTREALELLDAHDAKQVGGAGACVLAHTQCRVSMG